MLTGLSAVALAGVLTAATLSTSTADLLAASDAPEGYVLVEKLSELRYDELAETSPYSVVGVDHDSAAADDLRAGHDVWGATDDATMRREVFVWPAEAAAKRYLDDVVSYARGEGLTEVEPPFDGARAFAHRDEANDASVRMVVWRHGMIGAAISHFHYGTDPGADTIRQASLAFADGITATSGFTITVTPPDEEPVVVPDSTAPPSEADARSGGGIPIGLVLLWLLLTGGAVWLFVRARRKLAETSSARAAEERRERTVDEIIDEARGPRPNAGEPPDRSPETTDGSNERSNERTTDDIVAESRRRARREVGDPSDLDVDL